MNKLKQMYYNWELNNIKNAMRKADEIIGELFWNSKDSENNFKYKHSYLEHLRLMSCRSYLENKLSTVKI